MKTNNDYSWISEVHLITDPEFAEEYMALEMSAIAAMTILKDIIGQLIQNYPPEKIIHLSDLEAMIGDDDEEEVK
jgi:hypothetical protein